MRRFFLSFGSCGEFVWWSSAGAPTKILFFEFLLFRGLHQSTWRGRAQEVSVGRLSALGTTYVVRIRICNSPFSTVLYSSLAPHSRKYLDFDHALRKNEDCSNRLKPVRQVPGNDSVKAKNAQILPLADTARTNFASLRRLQHMSHTCGSISVQYRS